MMAFLPLLRLALPFLIAAGVGFFAAWHVQGLRIDAAENDFTAYKLKQQQAINDATVEAARQREASAADYRQKVEALKNDHEAIRRCVDAGKCGSLRAMPACTGIRLPSAGGIDAAGANAVPAAGDSAPPVIAECALTTLQLNALQADIERQKGY